VSGTLVDLLAVDTEAFAAEPYRVVPDTGYVPLWMREEIPPGDGGDLYAGVDEQDAAGILDESYDAPDSILPTADDGGAGIGIVLWLLLVGAAVLVAVVVASRAGRSRPAARAAVARTTPAGWYPDPWGAAGHRYWDGRQWTGRVLP
jgi:hypothetical protein